MYLFGSPYDRKNESFTFHPYSYWCAYLIVLLGGNSMAIHYHCRHCGMKLGTIEQVSVEADRLGFTKLTDEERQEIITYNENGDLHIKSICEDCQESLQKNPEYYQNDFLIH